MEIKPGILVRSKAGRDKDHVYAVVDLDEKYFYVADGVEKNPPPNEKKEQQASSAYFEDKSARGAG